MDLQQTVQSPTAFPTGQEPPMVKQNSSIPINLQNQQYQSSSGASHLASPSPRFLPPNNNPVDGPTQFQHSGGPLVWNLDNRSQLNSGVSQGQFPPPRLPYTLLAQCAPPPKNAFFDRPPQPNSSPSSPPFRFSNGQVSLAGQLLGPRPPLSFNHLGFVTRPLFQSPGITNNDPRLSNRRLLQRNNSAGGIVDDPRLVNPNFSLDQRKEQNNDWRNQFSAQLSVDRMSNIDMNQLRRPLSSGSLQIDDNIRPKSAFSMTSSNSDSQREEQRLINNDTLVNFKNDNFERKNNVRNNDEIRKQTFIKSVEISDRKTTTIESSVMKVQESKNQLQSGLEKPKEAFTLLPDIKTRENFHFTEVKASLSQSPLKTSIDAENIERFNDGQKKSLSSARSYTHQSPKNSASIPIPISVYDDDEAKVFIKKSNSVEQEITKVGIDDMRMPKERISSARVLTKSPSTMLIKTDAENDSGVDESTQRREMPRMNGVMGSPKKSHEGDKRSTASSPIKSPTKSIKFLHRTSDAAPSTTIQDKKKVPMNKIQVGAVPSPNLKSVRSKIGSLDNTTHKPGGGNVKIENRKLDFSKATPKIAAKNDKYIPSGGDKKIQQVKLQWNAKPKIGSLDNAAYKPGGGDKKIETVKLDFKDKAKSKVGSKENFKHVPGGGSVKSSLTSSKIPQDNVINIETQKIEIKAESKIGSLNNVKYKPGGGDKKIFDDKTYLRHKSASIVGSVSGSGSQSPIPSNVGPITDKNGLPISDENLNQEC